MVAILTYLHLIAPCILLPPLLTLVPPPSDEPSELPGITPVTIRRITPRRGFTLFILTFLAFSSTLDAAILIADIATAKSRNEYPSGLPLAAGIVYAFGGLCIWALTAIVIEWRAKWGEKALVVLATLGLVVEIPNLIYLVLDEIHTDGPRKIFTILSIPPSALRILLLSVLIAVVSSPIIKYEPASERSGLLSGTEPESRGRQVGGYGTFENGSDEDGQSGQRPDTESRVSSQKPGTATPATAGPSGGVTQPVIPKKLGEVKKQDRPLTLKEILDRLKVLAPKLWPSTSRRLQGYVLICIILILAARVMNPFRPIALGEVVRGLTNSQKEGGKLPWMAFGAFLGLRLLLSGNGLLPFIQNTLWVYVAQYTDREMMMLCFNHLLNLSLAYHTKRNTGEVLKIIDRGSAINNLFQTLLFTAIPTLFDIIIAFGVFFYLYGPLLACVTLLIITLYIVFSVTHTNWRMKLRRIMVEKDIKQRGIVSDVLTNWESVKYFTAEQRESKRFEDAILSYQETESSVLVGYQFLSLVQTFLLILGLSFGCLILAFKIFHGEADAAEFVVFIQYYGQLQGPMDRFAWLYRILNTETTDAEKLFTLLSQKTEVNDKPGAKDLVVTDGVIEFKDVWFSYDGEKDALKGVSFKINKGESMALIGESGSGKSTILRLLYRFYDITSGHIYIDGQDISSVTQQSLRRAIGIVPQDSVLWNDTIGANISYGKEGADDDDIITAAKNARLHDRIMGFTDQYSTIVGERGIRLSGGEKQRVSLARMFLKDPAILVLDEATSALDTETEREIQRALADLARGRSSLSIAHRLSTIINSDQIVVMKDGKVIEHGSYKDLVDVNDGAFANMWKKQIFTEAEMLAQAEGVSTEEAVDELGERDLINMEGEIQGDNADESKEPGKEGSEKPDDEHGAKVQPEVSYADVVKSDGGPGPSGEVQVQKEGPGTPKMDKPQGSTVSQIHLESPVKPPKLPSAVDEPTVEDDIPPTSRQSEGEGLVVPSTRTINPNSSLTESPSKDPTALQTPETPSSNPSPPRQSSDDVDLPSSKVSPFPNHISSLPHSESRQSNISFDDSNIRPSMDSRTGSSTDLLEGQNRDKDNQGGSGDKRRKRLSSLKGFVRRISDQNVLSRSNSGKRLNKELASPSNEEEPLIPGSAGGSAGASPSMSRSGSGSGLAKGDATPPSGNSEEKRKKRLSLVRSKSDK